MFLYFLTSLLWLVSQLHFSELVTERDVLAPLLCHLLMICLSVSGKQ